MTSAVLIRARAYAVHLLTASGIVAAFFAVAELLDDAPDERVVFAWLIIAVVIDAVDGPLARAWDVKRFAADIDGRTIDDIVDYLTFTFLPLLLVWRMGWLPQPAALWVVPALVASLFGFANTQAKDEAGGFFLGFPSYWNIVALYCHVARLPPGVTATLLLVFVALVFVRVGYVYPSRTPVLRGLTLALGAVWAATVLAIVLAMPDVPRWLWIGSLFFPVYYVMLSLALQARRRKA